MWAAVLLAAGAVTVFYVIIGYPLLLALIRWRLAPPVRKDLKHRPTVSVIMAVHNGERFIRAKLETLLSLRYPAGLLDILVVSDDSTDGTDSIVQSFASRGVRLLRVPRGGKAAALNAGIRQASGEILFFTDVRQALNPDALAHLAANFADPSVGVATGELRYLQPGRPVEQADLELYWRYELWARRRQSGMDSIFGATGCIYAMRRSLAAPIPPDTLSDDVLIPVRVFLSGYRVVVDPEALAFDYPAVEGQEFRRKLRTLAGLWQVLARVPALFASSRMRFHFLSHKFARLLLPWAILLVWGATVALPAKPFRTFLLTDEAMFVALALMDRFIPAKLVLKRLTSPARTFMALNAAALLSVVVFIVPPGKLWGSARVDVGSAEGSETSATGPGAAVSGHRPTTQ